MNTLCKAPPNPHSSPLNKSTTSAPTLHHISHDVRMRDFAAYTAARVSLLLVSTAVRIAIAELRHKSLDCGIVCGIGVGAQ